LLKIYFRFQKQRPPAKELLKHRFIKGAKKTSYLTELIDRHERWIAEGNKDESSSDEEQKSDGEEEGGSWDFGTVNAKSSQGKVMAAVIISSLDLLSSTEARESNLLLFSLFSGNRLRRRGVTR